MTDHEAEMAMEIGRYYAAFDAQPWATDEPARVQLDRITKKIEALKTALADAISTYNDKPCTFVSAERQEAWIQALNS